MLAQKCLAATHTSLRTGTPCASAAHVDTLPPKSRLAYSTPSIAHARRCSPAQTPAPRPHTPCSTERLTPVHLTAHAAAVFLGDHALQSQALTYRPWLGARARHRRPGLRTRCGSDGCVTPAQDFKEAALRSAESKAAQQQAHTLAAETLRLQSLLAGLAAAEEGKAGELEELREAVDSARREAGVARHRWGTPAGASSGLEREPLAVCPRGWSACGPRGVPGSAPVGSTGSGWACTVRAGMPRGASNGPASVSDARPGTGGAGSSWS